MITRTEAHETRFYSLQSLAMRWQVEESTVRKWVHAGVLRAHKLGPKVWRVEERNMIAFERGAGGAISDACSS